MILEKGIIVKLNQNNFSLFVLLILLIALLAIWDDISPHPKAILLAVAHIVFIFSFIKGSLGYLLFVKTKIGTKFPLRGDEVLNIINQPKPMDSVLRDTFKRMLRNVFFITTSFIAMFYVCTFVLLETPMVKENVTVLAHFIPSLCILLYTITGYLMGLNFAVNFLKSLLNVE